MTCEACHEEAQHRFQLDSLDLSLCWLCMATLDTLIHDAVEEEEGDRDDQ